MDKKKKLTPKQEKFCKYYTQAGEFFGNGVQSYIKAYNVDTSKNGAYNRAKANAGELLTKRNILDRINHYLEVDGFNDEFIDKQLKFLLTQNADFNAKMRAIQEYNKLKQRITEKKEQYIKSSIELSDEQLDRLIKGDD